MALLTTNHRLFWFSTGATIPGGFSRHNIGATARFLSGAPAATDPGSTGGSTTHTHTATSHDHASNSHTHSFSGSSTTHSQAGTDPGGAGAASRAHVTHGHSSATSGASGAGNSTSSGYNLQASSAGATTPPYIECILIGPDADGRGIPDVACALFGSATPPSGFSNTDGGGGTFNADGRYVRVAADATTDGGATGGTTAAHTHTADSHTHDMTPGNHADATSGNADATVTIGAGAAEAGRVVVLAHHLCTFNIHSGETLGSTAATISNSSAPIEPAHVRLAVIQNTLGIEDLPVGTIVPYVGTLAQLAGLSDWALCDGSGGRPDLRSKQVKGAFTSVGTSAGSNTHSHSPSAHTHTHTGGHTHTVSDVVENTTRCSTVAGTVLRESVGNQHDGGHTWTVGSTTPTVANDSPSVGSSDDHRDPYLEVLWVQYLGNVNTIVSHGQLYAGSVVLAG